MNRIKAVILALVMLFSAIGLAQTVVPILAATTAPPPSPNGCAQMIPSGNYFAINFPLARLCGGDRDPPHVYPAENMRENVTRTTSTS